MYGILFAGIAGAVLSCRNENLSENYANSQREKEFFKDAMNKTSHLKNGNNIVQMLISENEKSHFVSKIIDQKGLPVWGKLMISKKSRPQSKGEDENNDFDELIIPLSENGQNLSSILYVDKNLNNSFIFNNINNDILKNTIFNSQIDKNYREQLLSSFLIVDKLVYDTPLYHNIPDDLYTFIPENTTYSNRRFSIHIDENSQSETGDSAGFVAEICFTFEIDDPNCSCHGSTTGFVCSSVYVGGPENNGDGNPPPPGDGGDSGGGGNGPGNNDDCYEPNGPFYIVLPDGCGDYYTYAYYSSLTAQQINWLNQHSTIASNLNNYILNSSNHNEALNFVKWAVNFFTQNPSTTWAEFYNEILNVPPPDTAIQDMQKFLSCFNIALPANLTVYAQNYGDSKPGHAFISIYQGNDIMTFGFYPKYTLGSLTGPGIFGDDSGHAYTYGWNLGTITPTQLQQIINTALQYSASLYDLGFHNCSDFTLDILNIAGVSNSSVGVDTPNTVSNLIKSNAQYTN
ncbi:MAG: hypothetical protein LBV67_01705, partial [Streptococcaceae bacterium]|nr:hypothetical protein [Streptococcaceae bacterium]